LNFIFLLFLLDPLTHKNSLERKLMQQHLNQPPNPYAANPTLPSDAANDQAKPRKQLPPEGSTIMVEEKRRETFIPAPDGSPTKKKAANGADQSFLSPPETITIIKSTMTTDGNNVEVKSGLDNNHNANNEATRTTENTLSPEESVKATKEETNKEVTERVASRRPSGDDKTTSKKSGNKKGKESSKKTDDSSNNGSRRPTIDSENALTKQIPSASKTRPNTQSNNNNTNSSKKAAASLNVSEMDDEASVTSLERSHRSLDDSYPSDRNELVKLLKAKEQILKEKEKNFDEELKKRVKEYIRSHGIGFGANS
jgi:hypothetical protein